jgi:hypothetical protein
MGHFHSYGSMNNRMSYMCSAEQTREQKMLRRSCALIPDKTVGRIQGAQAKKRTLQQSAGHLLRL